MIAFLFTLTLFLYWAVVGLAVMSIFPPRLRILQGLLISPAVGIATVILPVFLLSRAGLPVKDFVGWLLPILGAVSLVTVFICKPILPWKHLRWFGLILVGALLLAGWPMLLYGFDWVSFANDDMANYSLAAQRFLNHGYFDLPNINELLAGRDYSQAYWFMHAAGGVRAGSELMLAAVWGLTGLNAHQIFMPVIMALQLSLICGGAALAAGPVRSAKAPLIAAGLLAISPLTTLGTLYQLIGQVGGLTLLTVAVALFYRQISIRPVTRLLRASVAGGVIFGALFVWYPEVLPFLGLGWFVYLALKLRQEGKADMQVLMPALVISGFILVTLGGFVFSSVQFMLKQSLTGTLKNQFGSLFPYFMLPSGLPALVGLIPFFSEMHAQMLNVSITVAIVLIVWILKVLIPRIKQAFPAALVMVVFIFMWLLLFFKNSAFALFKLSMYMQPFLLAVIGSILAEYWGKLNKRKIFIIVVILAANIVSAQSYVNKSAGELYGSSQEIPGASSQKVNKDFSALLASIGEDSRMRVSDAENIVLAKFQALYFFEKGGVFLSRDFFGHIVGGDVKDDDQFRKKYHDGVGNNIFQLNGVGNAFKVRSGLISNDFLLITTNRRQAIFNSYETNKNSIGYFRMVDKPVNHLVFVHSELGNHYYLGDYLKGVIAYYPLEQDPMLQGRFVAGLGRHQLFMAIGATERSRLVLELTATVLKQFNSALPQPILYGESSVTLPFVGRGSGRIFSGPVIPQTIGGLQYVGIDMGRDGLKFPFTKTGLMLLYGREISKDPRSLTAFGRDISLISEADYQALKPPHALSNFPADLADRGLEYSGIYEDGWVSERSFFILAPQTNTRYLVIKGMVPLIAAPDFRNNLAVSIDGREVVKRPLGVGAFEVKVPVSSGTQRHRIDLAFDRYQVLPGVDARSTGGKIEFIGYVAE